MPGWVQSFVNNNPISHLATAARGLMHGSGGSVADVGTARESVAWVMTGVNTRAWTMHSMTHVDLIEKLLKYGPPAARRICLHC